MPRWFPLHSLNVAPDIRVSTGGMSSRRQEMSAGLEGRNSDTELTPRMALVNLETWR
jgi:hypothetical protein